MTTIDDVKKEMRKLEGQFDFSKNATIDAEDVYKNFFKLDYQARKIRGLLMEARDITPS